MSNNQLMTPDTAPRDAAALAKQGPFIHRRLGEALELLGHRCWNNDREKSAFVTASPEDRGQMLLSQLQAYDAVKGGGAPPPQTPAAAAPEAAPEPAPATSGRSPRTPGQTPMNGAAASGNVVELLNAIKDISGKIGDLTNQVTQASPGTVSGQLQALQAQVAASLFIQKVELGLLCLLCQETLGCGVDDFIESAVTDGAAAVDKLNAYAGKD